MNKNKRIIISVVLIVLILLISISVMFIYNRLSNFNNVVNDLYNNVVVNDISDNKFKYIIEYYEDYISPPGVHKIYVYDNYDILINSKYPTNIIDLESGDVNNEFSYKTFNFITKLSFNEENKKAIIEYLDTLFKGDDDNYIEIQIRKLDSNNISDINNIDKIVAPDESSLSYIKKYDLSKDYDYKLSYYDSMIDYEIIKFDDMIKVIKKDKLNKEYEEYLTNFSDDNMKKINETFSDFFEGIDNKELKLSFDKISYEQKNVMDAIINNDEMYMDYLFILEDISCDCFSNSVYFLEDGKYVVKSVEINNEYEILSEGKYSYDINKILNNLDELKEDSRGMNYNLVLNNGKKYIVSHNDLRMIGLLRGLDIKWH